MGDTLSIIKLIIPLVTIIVVVLIIYFIYNFFSGKFEGDECFTNNGTVWPFSGCDISAGLCCNGKCSKEPCNGTEQGGQCFIDSDCKDWSTFGNIACCKGKCMTKAWTGQVCTARVEGDACNEPQGTVWPFSGCDASAGRCCNGKCTSAICPANGEGDPCSAPSGTWWPWSGCDITAGLCCDGVCSKSCN